MITLLGGVGDVKSGVGAGCLTGAPSVSRGHRMTNVASGYPVRATGRNPPGRGKMAPRATARGDRRGSSMVPARTGDIRVGRMESGRAAGVLARMVPIVFRAGGCEPACQRLEMARVVVVAMGY